MDLFHHKHGGIHLVVIDGIADLIRSANDETESIAIVDELYRLAGIYNTCIICGATLSAERYQTSRAYRLGAATQDGRHSLH
jgi:toprim domain protein